MRIALGTLLVGMCLLPGTVISQTKAPNFNLETASGGKFHMKEQIGKVVVVNFWATWCRPCVMEMPGFSEVYDKYKSKGLQVVGISLDREGWAKVKPFLSKTKVNYPIVIGDDELYLSYGGESAIPTTVFVDKKGNIVATEIGMISKEDFEKKIKSLL